MKKDFYDVLDVPENASATWIVRAYQKRLLAIEQDVSLKAKKRVDLMAEINEAHRTLADDNLRAAYDVELAKKREVASGPTPLVAMLRILFLVGIPLAAAGTYLYVDHQAKARIQQEQAEQAVEAQRAEARRLKIELDREAAAVRDRQERDKAELDRIESRRVATEEEMRNKRFVPAPTLEQIAREKQAAELAARQRQNQEEMDKIKAQMELERQKRFLREAGQR